MSPKLLYKSTFLIKQSYQELNNSDKITYAIYSFSLIICIIIFILNTILGYRIPQLVAVFTIICLLIGIHLYFNLRKHFTSSVFSITSLNILIFFSNHNVGLTSSYFLYSYVLLCGIPFISKRDKFYLKNSITLSLITAFFAILSVIFSPDYNTDVLPIESANQKLFTNSILSFVLFLVFSFFVIKITSNYIVKLINAKVKAEKEKDTKTRVLSNLGHELRTQISSINGITQLLLEHNNNQDLNTKTLGDYSDTLEVCNQQMLFLVNDILDIHKIESGNFNLIKKADNLANLLNKVTIPFKNIASEKGLVFEVSIDDTLNDKILLLDSLRLTQVIQNLISNAIKFTKKGYVKFLTDVNAIEDNTISISFSVKDSGIGISKENTHKVFESFQQVTEDTNNNFGGTGLGLAISKTIIEEMNSTINVSSKIGIGSNFNFTVNFEVLEKKDIKETDKVSNIKNEFLKGRKILVTEDNKISMLFASKLLEKNNVEVLKAYNGLEAVEHVKNHSNIDLILLDLEMPEMNGFTAIKHIKSINKKIPVIAFTANIPDEDLFNRLNNLNFDGFLAKPFKNNEMFKILNKHLS